MMIRNWPSILLCGALTAAGCRTQPVESPAATGDGEQGEGDSEATDSEATDSETEIAELETDGNSDTGHETAEDEGPSVEEQLALEAVRDDLKNKAGEAEAEGSNPLRFAVVQRGPHQPWIMGVVNQGETMVSLVADPRLSYAAAKRRILDEFEHQYLTQLLHAHGGNVSAAARAAQLDRPYMYKLLYRHGLRAKD